MDHDEEVKYVRDKLDKEKRTKVVYRTTDNPPSDGSGAGIIVLVIVFLFFGWLFSTCDDDSKSKKSTTPRKSTTLKSAPIATTTIGGWTACSSKQDMIDYSKFQTNGNTEAMNRLGASRCFTLKDGHTVTITDSTFGLVEIDGRAWTYSEAIRR